ncbi:zinc finger protein swm isoform X1 [Drosophila subpulchrella]|uniref:zinc finger protein swm isoform X1 n=1 Tax=Drosophila subpulchrella TaxID=1486046 RepID=UPI0018A1919F|nr:zinc finger protein swm isoform X1 [Drosophila subpulchrella]
MILENSDKLKDWLSVVLEPLCDADSSALARYVIALLKKDKSDKDLKRIMIEQLDVFLSEETTRFVERLFDAIASEEYLTVPAAPLITASSASANELDLDQELALAIDGAQDIEAVLAADSPPPPPKDNVINPDSNQVKLEQVSHDAREAEALAFISQEAGIGSQTDVKPVFDQHKTKESHNPQSASNYQHHHVRSASPPGRSSGVSGTGGGGPGGAALTAGYADKENQPRDSRRRRASLRSRSRSRSRSNERAFRRSRSRDRRVNDREKTQRQFRNKSPPGSQTDNRHHGRRNFDRRRIGGNADERPRFGNTKSRRSHSRSMSPERNARRNQSSPERVQAAQPNQVPAPVAAPTPVEHPAAHPRQRCRDFDEKGYCVRGETCPWDHGINPVVFEGINNSALMMSMREYNPDAPEIWARGGAPPPGAGQGTVPPPTQPGQTTINPFTGNVRPSTLMSGSGPNGPMGVPNPADYARNPGAPPQSAMMPFPFNPTAVTTPLQRQLIPIPVVDGAPSGGVAEVGKRRFELEDTVAIADVPTKRKVPINSRLGPRVNPNMQQHNSSLELRKVPRGLNTIAHLNNHFAKFGKIVNIQVSYEGDPEAAIVTFSTHAEANVAYRSTEAVLNNRFIKVFWHNDSSGADVGQMNQMGGGGGGRKNASQYHLHNVPAVPTPNADSAKISNANPLTETGAGNIGTPTTEQASTAAPASMRLKLNTTTAGGAAGGPGAGGAASGRPMNPTANAASIRKKQEEQQKAVHQLANGLRKRKQELLQSYMKQMKTALELVERMDQQDAQRAPTLQTIKVLQMTIDKLGKEIQAEQDQLQAQIHQQQQQQQPPVKKTKEQQKKELLDMELELIAQQQEGNDTTAIQKRLEELQRNLGVGGGPGANNKSPHFAAASGAPGGGAGRKRPNLPEGPTRVDRRPKAIVVTGFAAEEADFVLGHFKNFGEISKHDVDREIPQLILSYATRLNAEQAVLRGKMYKDKRLQISWAPVVTPAPVPMAAPVEKSTAPVAMAVSLENPKQLIQSVSESESLLGSDTLPELRLEDEEEDEESEDRSWRR